MQEWTKEVKPKEVIKHRKSLYDIITSEHVMNTVRTVTAVIMAVLLFAIGFGIVNDFEWEKMIEWRSTARVVSFFLILQILSKRGVELGDFLGRSVDKVKQLIEKLIEETIKVDDSLATEWVKVQNEKERNLEIAARKEKLQVTLNSNISTSTTILEHLDSLPVKWWRFIRKKRIKKYVRIKTQSQAKLDRIDTISFELKYKPMTIDDYKYNAIGKAEKRSKKKRYNESASSHVYRIMTTKNLFQSVLMFGLGGFFLVSATTGTEMVVYGLLVLGSGAGAFFGAYVLSFKRVIDKWYFDQTDKLHDLTKMNQATQKKEG